jgi:hypothetical protein
MTAASILVFTTLLIGFGWTYALDLSARRAELGRGIVWQGLAFFAVVATLDLALAHSGVLGRFDRLPPPVAIFFVFMILGVSAFAAFSKFGTLLVSHISLPWLVGFQAFRILAETVLVLGHREGLAPTQLTLHGYNFDIVTGVTALAVARALSRRPNPKMAYVWNCMGVGFLIVIAFIALTSMPAPFRLFMSEPSNEWVTRVPYVLLPGILVVAALTGHLLVFRKLALDRR